MISNVISKANGVFLCVRLAVNMLLDTLWVGDSIEQIEQKIDTIPPCSRGPQSCYANVSKCISEY
jgi:hypothetical protein